MKFRCAHSSYCTHWLAWLAVLASQAACGDSSPATLTDRDTLVLTPGAILLSPPPLTDAVSSGQAQYEQQKTIVVYGALEDGRTAEGRHVDVCIGSCDHPGSLPNAALPSQEALTERLVLTGSPASDSNPACQRVSDASVRCILSVEGTATFGVEAKAAWFGSDGIPIVARSDGAQSRAAKAWIGNRLPNDSRIEFNTPSITVPAKNGALACGSVPEVDACDATDRTRSGPFTLRLVRNAVGGEGGGGAPNDSGALLPGTFVDTTVKILPAPGKGSSANGHAWIADTPSCSPANAFNMFATTIDGATGASPVFYVCVDGNAGDYQLSASAVGGYAEGQVATTTAVAEPQPGSVSVVSASATPTSAATFDVTVKVLVRDCAGTSASFLAIAASLSGVADQNDELDMNGHASFTFPGVAAVDGNAPEFVFLAVSLPESGSLCAQPLAAKLEVP